MLADSGSMTLWPALVVVNTLAVCWFGVRDGLERVVRFMMPGLFAIMVVLAVRALSLAGSGSGMALLSGPDL